MSLKSDVLIDLNVNNNKNERMKSNLSTSCRTLLAL